MPPSRRSSSSRSSSSRSRSSSSSRRSSSSSRSYSSGASRRSSSSYRSSSYGSRSYGSHSYGSGSSGSTYGRHYYGSSSSRDYYNDSYSDNDGFSLKDALDEIFDYVPMEVVGDSYVDSYDDEDYGRRQYNSSRTIVKKPDEPQKAHYVCEFCNSELEEIWKEGYYPTCKNCGAQMTKQTKALAESGIVSQIADGVSPVKSRLKKKLLVIPVLLLLAGFFPQFMFGLQACVIQEALSDREEYVVEDETNLQIYGPDIYLDNIYDDTYRICESDKEYEKHISWDYNIRAYYDKESDCYLWYNTDVSPNVWQYWYEDIVGDNYYGWMEYYDGKWYIEVSDTEWKEYTSDTSDLWHIGD